MSANKKSMAEPIKRKKEISKQLVFLLVALALVVGFIGGTRSSELLGRLAPILGMQVETGSLDLSSTQEVYRALKTHFDGELSDQALVDGASRGLVEAAGDRHTVYFDAKEAEEFRKSMSGDIGGGIGAEIGVRNDRPTIIRTLAGNPAVEAGVKAGDVIISVNGESTEDWDASKTAMKIRGEAGTTVKLGLLRGDKERTISITRAIVDNPSVHSEIAGDLGIMTISRFDDETGTLARKAAKNFQQHGVKGVILDLRGNGGGYVTAAKEVAGLWLKNKLIVTERSDGEIKERLTSDDKAILQGMETVVLVDGGSASASEIVAGALQDHDAAKLVGEKTFGKGSVQMVVDLQGGALLKVTVAKWFTPHGKNIGKEGIKPDKVVKLTAEQINDGLDPQLKAAKQLLKD